MFTLIISLNLLLGVSFADDCNILDTTYIFLEALIKQHVETKYQDVACLEFFVYRNNSDCDFKNIFRPIDTEGCRYIREESEDFGPEYGLQRYAGMTAQLLKHFLYELEFDPDEICPKIREFNLRPLPERTKDMYAAVYDSSAKYAVYGMSDFLRNYCTDVAKNFLQCMMYANAEALKYLGNLSPAVRENKKCREWEKGQRMLTQDFYLYDLNRDRAKPGIFMTGVAR